MKLPTLLLAAALLLLAADVWSAPFVPKRDPQCVAFAPSGTLVATACSGMSDSSFPPRPHPDVRKCGVVAIWDVASGKRLKRWETFGDVTKLAFSPDGSLLAAARLYQTADGLALHEVRVWDVATGKTVKALDRCEAFDFSPDGKSLAVLSRTKCAIYELADWRKETLIKPLGQAISLLFSADGTALCGIVPVETKPDETKEPDSQVTKYRIRVCDVATAAVLRESLALEQPFYTLAASADGKWLASGHEAGNVVLWDYATLDVRTRFQTGERGLAHPFFSPTATELAAGCQENGDVVIWNLESRQEVGRLTFEKGSFRTYLARDAAERVRPEKDPGRFAFSPDGQSILIGCYGGIVRATDGGQELHRFGE
jgi:WD40 repeat protein